MFLKETSFILPPQRLQDKKKSQKDTCTKGRVCILANICKLTCTFQRYLHEVHVLISFYMRQKHVEISVKQLKIQKDNNIKYVCKLKIIHHGVMATIQKAPCTKPTYIGQKMITYISYKKARKHI